MSSSDKSDDGIIDSLVEAIPDEIKPTARKTDLTQGSVQGHILRMLGPFAIAVLALLSAGIIDTIYLGNLSDPDRPDLGVMALAAVGFAYPLTFLGNSANIGLGAGTMSAVSRATGEGEDGRAKRHAAAAILFALLVMSILITLMLLAMPFMVGLSNTSPEIEKMALQYLMISLPGLVIVSIANMSNNILRAGGEAALPSLIMITGAVINIILDPFLIFGWGPFPRLEIQGAAIATVTGNVIAAALGFYIVQFRRKAVDFAAMTWHSVTSAWKIIGKVGLPAALTNMIVPAGTYIAVTSVSRQLGDEAVAAFTLTSRAELLSVGLLYALSACIGAVTGQNGGAGKTERVREAFKICYKICLGWSFIMAIVLFFLREPVTILFLDNSAEASRVVFDMALDYFWIVPITIFAYGFVFVSAAGFNALGRPLYGLTYTIIRSLVLYAPLVALGSALGGLVGAFIGIAAANLISGFVAAGWSLTRAPMTAKKS